MSYGQQGGGYGGSYGGGGGYGGGYGTPQPAGGAYGGGGYGGSGGGYGTPGDGYGGYTEPGFAHHHHHHHTGHRGPPPGADPQLWSWFAAVDTNASGQLTIHELQKALVNGDWTPFDLDTVRMLMSIFDTDRTGTIGFNEFSGLWKYIQDWQSVYHRFDRDRSGTIDFSELRDALTQFGYNLSPRLLTLIERKYGSGVGASGSLGSGAPPGITFDRFVRACVVVKQLTEAFQRVDTNRDGWVELNYEQFMDIVLSAP